MDMHLSSKRNYLVWGVDEGGGSDGSDSDSLDVIMIFAKRYITYLPHARDNMERCAEGLE